MIDVEGPAHCDCCHPWAGVSGLWKKADWANHEIKPVLSALSWSLPPFQPLVPTRTSLSDRDGDMWAEINSISSQSWRRSWSFITAIDGLTKTKVTLMSWKIRMSKWTSTGPVLHNRDHSRKACANWQCDSKICLGIRKAKGSLDVCVADIHPEKQTLSMVKGMMGAINLL